MPCTMVGSASLTGALIQCGTGWTETGLTWNNRPANTGSILSTWTPAAGSDVVIDVTAAVDAARSASATEIAFKVYSTTDLGGSGNANYGSKENASPSLQPRFEVTAP